MLATLLIAGLLGLSPNPGSSSDALAARSDASVQAFKQCLVAQDNELRLIRMPPERYALAMSGVCQLEESRFKADAQNAMLTLYNPAWPEAARKQFTINVQEKIGSFPAQYKEKLGSAYAIWFTKTETRQPLNATGPHP